MASGTMNTLIKTKTCTIDAQTGELTTNLSNDIIVLSAYTSGYVLTPYKRPNAQWAVHENLGQALPSTCIIVYIL